MNWKKQAYEYSLQGYNARQIADKMKNDNALSHYTDEQRYERVRQEIKRERRKNGTVRNSSGEQRKTINKEKTSYKNGITNYEIERELLSGEEITPESIMVAKGLNPNEWEVISYTTNIWQQQDKNGNTINLCQSKLSVKQAKLNVSQEHIDNYFKNLDIDKLLPKTKAKNKKGKNIAELMLPDLHIGLMSYLKETGNNNDLKIIKDNYFKCLYEIKEQLERADVKKIFIVTLGDILHVDNDNQTTTKGTLQQVDGRISKIVEVAEDMLIGGILLLGELAPVEVVYIAGNHDRTLGYMLMRSVYRAFENDKNVVIDTEPNPHKHRIYYDTLIGYCHGDLPKKNIANNVLKTAQGLARPIKRIEVHSGHFHSEQSYETIGGVVVKHIPSICGASYWEHQQGYTSYKTMMCNLWNENGLTKTIYSNIGD